jgi:hypothetical protein
MLIRSFGCSASRLIFAAFAITACSAAAEAQYITYVATNGNDANPCVAVTAPCKTLQRAVNVTPANGTVRVLTPLQSSVFINKSILIEGDKTSIVGQITIGGATAVVTLRGLALDGVGGYVNGINITNAAAVHIEDCTVERYAGDGIKLNTTAATKLFVVNTVSRDNLNNGDGLHIEAVNAHVEIQDSRFDRNAYTGAYLNVGNASVTGSSASGNGQHGFVLNGRAEITETTANKNALTGFSQREGFSFLNSVEAHNNGTAGLLVEASGTSTISNCVFFGNSGYGVNNQGALQTRQNNSIYGYNGDPPTAASVL